MEECKNDAPKIWQTLKDIHDTTQPNCRFMAYTDLFALCKKPDESILDYSTWVTHAIADVKKLQPNKYLLENMNNELWILVSVMRLGDLYKNWAFTIMMTHWDGQDQDFEWVLVLN